MSSGRGDANAREKKQGNDECEHREEGNDATGGCGRIGASGEATT